MTDLEEFQSAAAGIGQTVSEYAHSMIVGGLRTSVWAGEITSGSMVDAMKVRRLIVELMSMNHYLKQDVQDLQTEVDRHHRDFKKIRNIVG